MPNRRTEHRIREWLSRLIPVPLNDIPESDRICTLCYEPFPAPEHGDDYPVCVRSTHSRSTCRHMFGRICIEQHLSSGRGYSKRCPTCRETWFGGAEVEVMENVEEEAEESAAAAAHRQRGRFRAPGATPEDRRLELLFGLEGANEIDREHFFAALDQTLRMSSEDANVYAIGHPPQALVTADNRLGVVREAGIDLGGTPIGAAGLQGGRRGSAEEEAEAIEWRSFQLGLRGERPTPHESSPQSVPGAIMGTPQARNGRNRESSQREAGSRSRLSQPALRREPTHPPIRNDVLLPSAGRITRTMGFLEQLRRTEGVLIDSLGIGESVAAVERAVGDLWESIDDDARQRRRVRFVHRGS